nr:hypothetical protein [Streptomyces cavernae]
MSVLIDISEPFDRSALPTTIDKRCLPRLQPSGVGKASAVVPDLGEHPGADLHAEAGEADDDLSVRVLGESLFDRLPVMAVQ